MYLNNLFDGFVVHQLAVPFIIGSEDMITAKIIISIPPSRHQQPSIVRRFKDGLLFFDGIVITHKQYKQ